MQRIGRLGQVSARAIAGAANAAVAPPRIARRVYFIGTFEHAPFRCSTAGFRTGGNARNAGKSPDAPSRENGRKPKHWGSGLVPRHSDFDWSWLSAATSRPCPAGARWRRRTRPTTMPRAGWSGCCETSLTASHRDETAPMPMAQAFWAIRLTVSPTPPVQIIENKRFTMRY